MVYKHYLNLYQTYSKNLLSEVKTRKILIAYKIVDAFNSDSVEL